MVTVKAHRMRPIHLLGHGQRGKAFIDSLEPQSTIWHHAAGVLAMAGLDDFQYELQQHGVPVVSFSTIDSDRYLHPAYLDMNSVVTKAYRHLVAKGCKRIALLANASVIEGRMFLPNEKGQLCFKPDLLADMPCIDASLIRPNCLTPKDGYQAMMQMWQSKPAFDGMIISNDHTTVGVCQAMQELKIQTPTQLKVVTHATKGVDLNFPLQFTQSQFDINRICRGAFGLLYRLMLGYDNKNQVRFTASIQQGQTT
jgi:DNA-binding LacI/PurR family transcriptional regulator